MTKVVEKPMEQWTPEEKKEVFSQYGCEIIIERATIEQLKDPSLPSDAYVVTYKFENVVYIDLCRGSRIKIFDMYYDKFGPGSIQKIDWGYGRSNPRTWGIKTVEKRKRK